MKGGVKITEQRRLNVEVDLYERLRQEAKDERRSIGEQLNLILEQHFQSVDRQLAAAAQD